MAENAPESKRQKMSTTTTDEDGDERNPENPETIPRKPKYKRRKIAIFFAYCGVGYQGMQKNPGAKTIEGDLEEALYLSGAVPESERGKPRRYDWARSARTDKGVSAVGQVVSGRFFVDPPGFVERLNANLVPQIRVFGYKRATPAFSSKKFCDRRRYVYLIPVFALDPSCHRDRESVLASLESESELFKCLECSERGRKVLGVMAKRSFESKSVDVGSVISSDDLSALAKEKIDNIVSESISTIETGSFGESQTEKTEVASAENNILVNSSEKRNDETGNDIVNGAEDVEKMKEDEKEDDKAVSVENNILRSSSEKGNVENMKEDETEDDKAVSVQNNILISSSEEGNDDAENVEKMKEYKMEDVKAVSVENNVVANSSSETVNDDTNIFECENENGQAKSEKKSEFKYGEEEKERFNSILKCYEGTHNFHNFTTRTTAEDPAAQRYILSFNANTVISIGGIDFVKCEVVGQSFMLHQIRKMIGLAVAIMRNCAPETLIETAFQKKVKITVPVAPEVGLYLDECFFPSYNQKWNDTHKELSMKDYSEEAEEFKMKHIYSHIASTEHKDGSMAIWLHSLNYRNYPDLHSASDGQGNDGQRNESVDNCTSSDVKQDEIKNMDE